MPVKTSRKKTTKGLKSPSAHQTKSLKPVKKTVKKITQADIEANFTRIQKTQDEAWAAIRETQQAQKETEKAQKEAQKGTQKARDEAWKAIRETQKNIGGLSNRFGSMVEHILIPGLPKKFKKFGYSFTRIASYKYADGVWAQIDGMLENGTQAIAVEVKFTLRNTDIDDHILRMEKIRKFADEHGDKRQFIGAIAAINTDESARNYALKKGLFVIEPRGEDVKVTKPEGEVRVW